MNDRRRTQKSGERSGGQKAPWYWKNERVNLKIVLLKSEADLYKLDRENLKKRGRWWKSPLIESLKIHHEGQKSRLNLKSPPRSKKHPSTFKKLHQLKTSKPPLSPTAPPLNSFKIEDFYFLALFNQSDQNLHLINLPSQSPFKITNYWFQLSKPPTHTLQNTQTHPIS